MWQMLQALPRVDDDSQEFLQEISRTVTRSTTLILIGAFLFWGFLAGTTQPVKYSDPVMLAAALSVVVAVLTYKLVEPNPLLAQAVFQLGVMCVITLGLFLFAQPEIGLLLIILPLIAAVAIGWPAAVLSDLLVIVLAALLQRYPDTFHLGARDGLMISMGGTLIGLLGGVTVTALLGIAQRSYKEIRIAQQQVAETRQQRLDLMLMQEELLQANRELARLSDRLKAMTSVAEESRRVKEEFVANVSHELRTPLNMIIGFSELIAKAPGIYGSLPPALLADIAAIQRNSTHLAELVNDVLDLSQVDAGRMTLIRDWATLQDLVEAAVGAIKVLYDNKNLYLKTELPDEPVRIFCDRTRIREVLLNLLSNAGRFTDQGGVMISAEILQDQLVVKVTDTGPGISIENQTRLFEPFQQLDNSIRRHGGTGLGLSISKRFVEMHEGKMWLESQVGVGTTFFFSLPLLQMPAPAKTSSGASRWITPYHQPDLTFRRPKAPAPVVLPRYVLLDHSDALKRLFSRHMEEVEIISEDSLETAIETLGRSPCQGLIVNGATTGVTAGAVRLARGVPFGTPVMTCWITGEDDISRKLGVVAYLLKPVSREKLLGVLAGIGKEIHTILLADDDLEVLQLFGRILNSADRGYVVLRARDGRQALEILRERRPDAMLIDLVMPEMDGFQVIKEKNQDESIRDIPVIVVSSKDPTGSPIVSESLTVARNGGLSTREMMRCIQAVGEILTPESPAADRARKGSAQT